MYISNAYKPDIVKQLVKLVTQSSSSCPYLTRRTESEVVFWLLHEYIFYGEDNGNIVGWIVSEPLTSFCHELKSFYVIPMYNGRGYGTALLDYALDREGSYLSVSSNPQVINMLIKRGFKRYSFFRLPIPVIYKFLVTRKLNSFKKGLKSQVGFFYKK